ncbi:outer membrane beta-barrel protein [Chitinophaga rhizophila]|uniref:Outer membrane beta-barrel protein n=1 Tax=Chitinophaga rhizophila TaxID=2866212 RepID=A0ABS7GJU9_9BACT|nr:outer membrane beta-barrel protein [Chitinophaga rhizophila]MBW8686927.1 outer membrane beta-barrel protein [Chitinophaga rhizophila]
MKKSAALFCALCAIVSTQTIKAQEASSPSKFYLKVAGGYYFSVFPGQFPKVGSYEPHDEQLVYNPATGNSATVSEKVLTGSYGAGGRGGLSFGWNINKYIAIEGTFNYYRSKTNLMTREVTTVINTTQTVGKVESHGYVNAIDFAPGVSISPGFAKVNPYVRFGLVVPLWGNLYIETDASRSGQATVGGQPVATQLTVHREEKVKPNVTLGFQGAMGVAFPVAKKMDIFVEAEYRNIPVRSKEKEVTSYDETVRVLNPANGSVISTQQRGLDDLSTAERHTKYVTTLDQSSNTPTGQSGAEVSYKDDNKPANDLKSYINIGGLGGNLGLRFRF